MDSKKAARIRAGEVRARAHAAAGGLAGLILARRGMPVPHLGCVSGFLPYRTEISLLPLLARLHSEGVVTALPVVTGKGEPMVFRVYVPGEALHPGLWDIPVPPETAAEVVPDILLTPLLAFDRAGYRLGYGGGFYDRTLEKLRAERAVTAIGVGYAAQQVDGVPRGPYDQPLNWIMTEEATFKCG